MHKILGSDQGEGASTLVAMPHLRICHTFMYFTVVHFLHNLSLNVRVVTSTFAGTLQVKFDKQTELEKSPLSAWSDRTIGQKPSASLILLHVILCCYNTG